MRAAELELARQAETAYRRFVSDWQPTQGRGRDNGTLGAHRQRRLPRYARVLEAAPTAVIAVAMH